MDRRSKVFGVTLCLVAMAGFVGWPLFEYLTNRAVSEAVAQRTRQLIEKNPQLAPALEVALQDGKLTYPEAKVIVEAAGEKLNEGE